MSCRRGGWWVDRWWCAWWQVHHNACCSHPMAIRGAGLRRRSRSTRTLSLNVAIVVDFVILWCVCYWITLQRYKKISAITDTILLYSATIHKRFSGSFGSLAVSSTSWQFSPCSLSAVYARYCQNCHWFFSVSIPSASFVETWLSHPGRHRSVIVASLSSWASQGKVRSESV